ncbi:MAG: SurA N-terminal domain-containing protein, partial [Ignavibacteria bacterium]
MNVKLLFLLFLCEFTFINAQSFIEDKIVAQVGSNNISSKEFLYRYELTPQLFRENRNIKRELKKEFIYSLIAEKLLAQYALDTALDTIQTVRNTIKNYERMFVRDALYKKEIESKGAVEVDSLLDIYLSGRNNLTLVYLTFTDEKQAKDIYNSLIEGKDFDSLYSYLFDHLKDTLLIKRGE